MLSFVPCICCSSGSLTMVWLQISTRLPAPEIDFQNSQPVVISFLSEVITANDFTIQSSFTECIVLATICARSLSHQHLSTLERVQGSIFQDFWDRHHW